ncbi:hypothetical protein SELMODRAFT_431353 [Selaginella moellendorffii]|uniref:Glycosyl transferase CAP10 domain-containing protein n=1 Tax=Selaginella moellendorffii TaxID=88036 RepID=D8TCB6_SELML|nr:O-glucosyltransferase rumi [Selaginella moellendorffii]EFJ05656.1 hypothetical protein SELMODRAFT_431353 [Selaginella moellendorffii]|eukprot:XP_002993235.1 O-glucosyltransferase rumi [Selaginella moellendorffii]
MVEFTAISPLSRTLSKFSKPGIVTVTTIIVTLFFVIEQAVNWNYWTWTLSSQNSASASDSSGSFFRLQKSDQEELQRCLSPNSEAQCPSYFSWIENDLAPWKETGISQQNLQDARSKADFRVVIVNGTLYMERYNKCFETRDDFTLWGLLMLLEEYPGMVPDVDLMFNCGDWPLVFRAEHKPEKNGSWPPPPLFLYCTSRGEHYDIVFPDWSYWGWPEVNILPWSLEKEKIFSGAKKLDWSHRQPIAFWKGNYDMGPARADLVKCTANNSQNYNLVTHHQDWFTEREHNFNNSDLSKQCQHRYKIYVQGGGWSVSFKYILACGSTVLQIEPMFQEFFARSLTPFVHFWPVDRDNICNSTKFAVDWGNAHPKEAAAIGDCAKSFLDKDLSMDFVYQYMLHLLQEYGKLLKFRPVPPPEAQRMTLESGLLGHELTLPRNGPRPRKVCTLAGNISVDKMLSKQSEGYKRIKKVHKLYV